MPEPPRTRPSRRARERSLRRRRVGALLLVAAIAGVVLALTLAFSSGNGGKKSSSSSPEVTTTSHPRTTLPAGKKTKGGLTQAKLDQLASHAVVRYAEIGQPIYCGGT